MQEGAGVLFLENLRSMHLPFFIQHANKIDAVSNFRDIQLIGNGFNTSKQRNKKKPKMQIV